MSYDIYLYKSKIGRPDVDEADAVIDADNDKWAKKEINPHIKLAIVKALTEYNPRLQAFDFHYGDITKLSVKTIEEEKNKFDHIEINASEEDAAVRLIVYDNHVFITVPYWYQGEDAKQLFKDIKSYIKIIRETAGFLVQDPQTGQVFDPAENNFEGLNKYLSVSEHLQEIISPNDNKLSSDLKPEHKKPWWKIW
jgi:hypothetical protein